MVEKRGDLLVRPFQGLKFALMHVSDLLPSFFEKKFMRLILFLSKYFWETHMHEHAF